MNRTVLKKVGEDWVNMEMKELVTGDVFKLAEPDGTPVGIVWIALDDPFEDADGTWGIECKDYYE